MAVPIVDFADFLNGNDEQKKQAAREIDQAFRTVGFVYLQNHSVATQKVEECFEWSKKFFALPEETKMLAPHPPGGAHHRGYSGLGLEKVTQNVFDEESLEALKKVPDVKESYESGNPTDAMQPNIWLPEEELPGFRTFMEPFFVECSELIEQVLQALALSLDLPETQLSKTHAQRLFQLRLLHYPSIPSSLLSSGTYSRISPHSDFGTLTLLFQDAIGGLEVENPQKAGEFRSVKSIPDTVLVNIGDLMERWSNGRWRSTVHRVVAPPDAGDGMCKTRYSIPFFSTADPDTVIEALQGCWDEENNPKKYESVTAWGYVQMRMAALYN